jgi:hypothetical protein
VAWGLVKPEEIMQPAEELFAGRLAEHASFLVKLGISPPLKWVCGFTRVQGFRLQSSNDPGPWGLPECVAANIVNAGTCDPSKESATAVLQPFFKLKF